jgi:hypothetical protein
MANQRQRRRRAKEKRHEYELVEIDAEGNETVLTSAELKPDEPEKSKAPAKAKGGSTPAARGRQPQPPSWQRVAKRGLIFAPIFFATVLLLGRGKVSTAGAVVQALLLLAVFVPFSYVMDRFVYRSAMKRTAKQTGARGTRP